MLALIEGAANWRLWRAWYPVCVHSISNETRERVTALWPAMCARLAAGDLVRDVYKDAGISPFEAAMIKASNAALRVAWDQAREASADALFDEAMNNARVDVDKELAQHVRTRIDTLKWAARIRNPRLYGDKAQLDVNVRTVDLTAIIRDANARLASANIMRVVNDNSGAGDEHARVRALTNLEPAVLADLI